MIRASSRSSKRQMKYNVRQRLFGMERILNNKAYRRSRSERLQQSKRGEIGDFMCSR